MVSFACGEVLGCGLVVWFSVEVDPAYYAAVIHDNSVLELYSRFRSEEQVNECVDQAWSERYEGDNKSKSYYICGKISCAAQNLEGLGND